MISVSQCVTRRWPARCQLFAPLDVVEQLAIEDHEDVAVFVGHRLLAIRQADNAQPARSQGDAGSLEETLLVRTAMHDGARHPLHDFVRRWLVARPDQ